MFDKREVNVLVIKKGVIALMIVLRKGKLQQFQRILVKIAIVKKKSSSFQSQEKEPICYYILSIRRLILLEFSYYSVYIGQQNQCNNVN